MRQRGLRLLLCLGGLLAASAAVAQEITWLAGHEDPLYAVRYAPNGKTLVSGDIAGSVTVWDRATGQPIRSLHEHRGAVLSVAVAPGGRQFATAGIDRTVRVYDLPFRGSLAAFTSFSGDPTALAVSPDGKHVVTGDAGRLVRRWNLENNQPLRDYGGSTAAVVGVVLHPGGETVLAACDDGSLRAWNLADAKPQGDWTGPPLTSLAIHPQGNLLATGGSDGLLRLLRWPVAANRQLATFGSEIRAVAVTADGSRTVTGGADQTVRVFDNARGEQRHSLTNPAGPVTSIAVAHGDSPLAAAGSDQGAVTFWDVREGKAAGSLTGHQGAVRALRFTADNQRLLTAGADGTVRLWQLPQPASEVEAHQKSINALAVSRDRQFAVTAAADKTLALWTLPAAKKTHAAENLPQVADCVAVSADGSLVAAGDAAGTIHLFTADKGKSLQTAGTIGAHAGGVRALKFLPGEGGLLSCGADGTWKRWQVPLPTGAVPPEGKQPWRLLTITADGSRLAAEGNDRIVHIYDGTTGKLLRSSEPQQHAGTDLAFDTKGERLLRSTAAGTLQVFDPDTAKPTHEQAGHKGAIHDLAIANTGAVLATAGEDGTVRTWNVTAAADGEQSLTLELEKELTGHQGAATAVTFLPDGKQLVTGGADKSVRLWDRAQGKVVRTFAGAAEAINAVAIAPEPGLVIAASTDKRLRAWNLADGKVAYNIELPAAAKQLAVDASGKRLVAAGGEATAQVWDAAAGTPMQHVTHGGTVASTALTADGRWLITAGTDKQLLRTAVACQQVVPAHEGKVNSLDVSADGKHIVTAGEDRLVKLWNAKGELVRQLSGAATALSHVAFSPDGQFIAAGGDPQRTSQEVLVWKTADGSLQKKLAAGAAVVCLAFDARGRLIVGGADSKMRSYEAPSLILGEVATLPAVPTAVAPHTEEGRYLAAAADGKLRGVTSHLERLLLGHEGEVHAVAIDPEGALAYSAGADQIVRQWKLSTGQAGRTYRGSEGAVLALELSPDGSQVFAGGSDKTLRCWNASNGRAAWKHALEHAVRSLHLADGGKRLVVGCDDPIVRVFDLAVEPAKPRLLETFTGHAGSLRAVAASADGSMIVSGGTDKTLRQWHSPVVAAAAAHRGAIAQVAFTPDGKNIVTAGADGKAILWDVQSLAQVRPLVDGKIALVGVAVDPSNQRVAAISGRGALHLVVRQTGEPLAAWQSPEKLRAVTLGPEGQILLGGESGRIVNLALSDDGELIEVQQFTDHTGPVLALAMAADGEFYSASADRTARRWFAATARPRYVLEGHQAQVVDLAYMSDTVLVSGSADGTARRWNLTEGGKAVECSGHDGPVLAVAARREAKEFLTAGRDGTLRFWNERGQEVGQWPVPQTAGTVYAAAWSPNERYVVTAGSSGQWQLWDRQTKAKPAEPERAMPGHSAAVLDVAWNASGQRFATVDQGGKLFLWNASDGNLLYHVQLPAPAAYGVAYSPDGKELAVATTDQRLVILAIPSFAQ